MEPGQLRAVLAKLALEFSPELYQQEPSRRIKRTLDVYWSSTFHEIFIGGSVQPFDRDDLLFYVKYDPKTKKDDVLVLRHDSKCIPEGADPFVMWDETLYMNLLLHEFKYHLTCCVILAGSSSVPLSRRTKNKVDMYVYPSHTERRMDKKGKEMNTSYPDLRFCVDNFQEVFSDIVLSGPGEKIAVQIEAVNPSLSLRKLVFVGGLDFKVLKTACSEKESMEKPSAFQSMFRGSKKKSEHELGNSFHFIPMSGPNGKGHAEMAVRISEPLSDYDRISEEEGSSMSLQEDGTTFEPIPDSSACSDGSQLRDNEPETLAVATSQATTMNGLHTVDDFCDVTVTDGGKMSEKSSKHKQQRSTKKEKVYILKRNDCAVHAYLTYVQLPWYIIMEDILRSDKEPVL